MAKKEQFTTRIGFILASLGMAMGTGNIWRFPRVAGSEGGGALVITWMIALLVWSFPLLLAEMVLGRHTRKGVVATFANVLGKKSGWTGGFVALVSTAIAFYYAVVTGWCLKYLVMSIWPGFSGLTASTAQVIWDGFVGTPWAVLFQAISLGLVLVVVARGIARGIELANTIMMPALFVILIILAIAVLTFPGASKGLVYLFSIKKEFLLSPKTWLAGFTQSAWSIGAGWGLLLTYAVYTKEKEDIALNSLVIGLSDNIASLVAGMAIIPTVFVFLSQPEAMGVLASGNEGLSFVWLPVLLTRLPLGNILAILFFLGLFLAAVASLISLVELPVRVVMDWGVSRPKATWIVGAVMFALGIPSALSVDFFKNQDWVWGLGLLLSGVFFVIASLKYGIKRMSLKINEVSDFPIPAWFLWVFLVGAVPVSFVILMGWWFWQSLSWGEPWWNPFGKFTIGTAVAQWVIAGLILWVINRALVSRGRKS